ncbi:DUF3606 domain-containing protein [Pararoseomonas indoligenes]|uniref:DUF3606 domain-containing protein n=1 Tax=Roseomonas indoligenes TaxID=2820811 RepID=A0A940S9J6_9PROT|nr:DUF3606 domain-containing protein [Pararoseomonas indoligenes]MBP0495343.1 DUF3606 domain-containing protein [Pararoseomonas indoligenes]
MSEARRGKPADRDHIDLGDPYCVQHWARSFGITELDLAIAVHRAGPLARDVALVLCQPMPGALDRPYAAGADRTG